MDILILTSGKENIQNATENRLQNELIRRGHSVHLLDTDSLEKTLLQKDSPKPWVQKRLNRFLSNHRMQRIDQVLAPALKNHLLTNSYDAILPAQVLAAEVVTCVLRDNEQLSAFTAMVSTEYDSLPRKAELSCDEYIVMSSRAIGLMIDWGIPANRIHLVQISDHTVKEICTLLEQLIQQWHHEISAIKEATNHHSE